MRAVALAMACLGPAAAFAQAPASMPGGERAIRLDELESLREQARTTSLYAGLPPSAVLERKEDLRWGWTVTAFSILWSRPSPQGGERGPHWVARKVEADGRRLRTVYADGRSCPALREVLAEAETLETPKPRFIFVQPARDDAGAGDILLHDTAYRLSTDARYPNGADGRVELRGGSRSPLASWSNASMRRLEPCWSDRVPPVH